MRASVRVPASGHSDPSGAYSVPQQCRASAPAQHVGLTGLANWHGLLASSSRNPGDWGRRVLHTSEDRSARGQGLLGGVAKNEASDHSRDCGRRCPALASQERAVQLGRVSSGGSKTAHRYGCTCSLGRLRPAISVEPLTSGFQQGRKRALAGRGADRRSDIQWVWSERRRGWLSLSGSLWRALCLDSLRSGR